MQRDDKILSLRSRSGFSLVELLVYMAILIVLMALVMTSFIQTQRRSAQQSGIAETQIETGVGLGLLRADLAGAGFGLPWSVSNPVPFTYTEPNALGVGGSNRVDVPAALDSANNAPTLVNGSDRLVIRATSATQGSVGQRWGTVGRDTKHNTAVQSAVGAALAASDWVIAVQLGNSDHPELFRSLAMTNTGQYAFQANAGSLASVAPGGTSYDPDGEKLLLYGISRGIADNPGDPPPLPPVRPFNRTDYYIANGASVPPVIVPSHCAPGTGVLVKAILNPDNNNFGAPQPVADCVADFQVVYHVGGSIVEANGLPAGGADQAEQIRAQVQEVRCYILLHEGVVDTSYTHPASVINVGEENPANKALLAGRAFDVENQLPGIGATWANYRWKVVNVTVDPKNLRQ